MKKINFKELHHNFRGNNPNTIANRICGELIGKGLYRDVYVFKQNPDYVVKIERDMAIGNFANATEWRNYINNKEWKWLEQWLAPCELINLTGQILIQQRVEHRPRKFYPTHVPACFTDLKLANFGFIGDRFVCCDYSFLTFVMKSSKAMRYAKWWNHKR